MQIDNPLKRDSMIQT